MDLAQIPAILKHMTVAVYFRKDVKGSYKKKFIRAFAIARGSLVNNGYLYRGGEKNPPKMIRLTASGEALNRKHSNEGRWKNQIFNDLFTELQSEIESADSYEKPKPKVGNVEANKEGKR